MAKYKQLIKENIEAKVSKRVRRNYGFDNEMMEKELSSTLNTLVSTNDYVYLTKGLDEIFTFKSSFKKFLTFETLSLKNNVYAATFKTNSVYAATFKIKSPRKVCVCSIEWP